MTAQLTVDGTAEVLQQMHQELGDFDPDDRALVAFQVVGEDEVELVDVEVYDNGILEVPEEVAGVILVTGDTIELAGSGETTHIRQLLAVLVSGDEVGVFRLGDDDELYVWDTSSDDPQVAELRPRDMEANMARRALGHASYIDDVSITEFFARLYLLHLAQLTLELADAEGGPELVSSEDLAAADSTGPFAVLLADDAYPDDEVEAARQLAAELTWEDVRKLAARGDLVIGPYEFDADHCDWLDARGFAQYFDETVMDAGELLGALEGMGDEDLAGWAIGQLLERDWYSPTVGVATNDLAAAAQAASNDPRYGDETDAGDGQAPSTAP